MGPRTPPTLLLQGGRDQYVRLDRVERLAARLRAAGVPDRSLTIPYARHGFDSAFGGWGPRIARPLIADAPRAYVAR